MKTNKVIFGLSILFFAGTVMLSSCGGGESHEDGTTEEATEESSDHHEGGEDGHDHEMHSTNGDQVAGMYICPMKCEGDKTYSEAGVCPECGMQLVAMEKPAGTDAPAETAGDNGTPSQE